MRYYSTNDRYIEVPLRKAIMQSVAPDGGVYMPDSIPLIPRALFTHIPKMSLTEIGYVAATTLFGSDIPAADLKSIVADTLTFPIPLHEVAPSIYALELFHGPTGTFKDVGARFMARLIKYYTSAQFGEERTLNVVVATSGNTGNAVANAFANIPGVNVIIFHPQRSAMRVDADAFATIAPNIHPIGIRGTFNECQQLVKSAYNDTELNERLSLTSANSINIARLLPQTFYFFQAYARLAEMGLSVDGMTIGTPCGNLGNLTAALFAKQMGLPLKSIIAAGQDNERLWGSIRNGRLAVNDFNDQALSTNLSRINSLIQTSPRLADNIECHTYTAAEIAEQIKDAHNRYGYLMNTRSALAFKAVASTTSDGSPRVFLATVRPDHDTPPAAAHRQMPMAAHPILSPVYADIRRYLIDRFSK
ncbi:MAG: pyridoxal-phosphate dependent enzyme [Paramuribaculum sp.]|nr:pyridoxal-phosphate dependent enzyme [Paramuribaculum sp.]